MFKSILPKIFHSDEAADFLVQPFDDFPMAKAEATWIPGAKEVMAIVALRAAREAVAGNLGKTIYFAGGADPWGKGGGAGMFGGILAQRIFKKLTAQNIPLPNENEREAVYGARVFKDEVEKRGGNVASFDICVIPYGTNFQAHFDWAERREYNLSAHQSVAFFALPYAMRRLIGTARKHGAFGDNPAIVPHLVWPEAIGIMKSNYRDSLLAAFMQHGELAKIGKPNADSAPYVKKGFCVPIKPITERNRIVRLLDQNRKPR